MKIKKLSPSATIPAQATDGSAGSDLCADLGEEDIHLLPGETKLIHTGIAIALDPKTVGLIFPRSGLATKRGLRLANSVAVIDSDYRGELLVALHNDSFKIQTILNGERIAQLVIVPYLNPEFEEVDELPSTDRGTGGFGSTGK